MNALAVSQLYAEEYWTEPALRSLARAADAAAMRVPDTVLPANLNAYEVQEAYRALKGQALRIETYAGDGTPAAENPYTITEQNFTLLRLQKMGPNLHAVFFVHLEPCGLWYVAPTAQDPNEISYVVARTAGAHRKYYFRMSSGST